jgi:hypothetical protein
MTLFHWPGKWNRIKRTTFLLSWGHFRRQTCDAIPLGRHGLRHTFCGYNSKWAFFWVVTLFWGCNMITMLSVCLPSSFICWIKLTFIICDTSVIRWHFLSLYSGFKWLTWYHSHSACGPKMIHGTNTMLTIRITHTVVYVDWPEQLHKKKGMWWVCG